MAAKRTTRKKVKGGSDNGSSGDKGGGSQSSRNHDKARKKQTYPPDNDVPLGPGEHSSPAVEIHNAFLVRHTGSGSTARSYERARAQFQRIRGAVRTPATQPNRQLQNSADAPSEDEEGKLR